MKYIRVGSGILNQTPMDWQQNKFNIILAIEEAKKQKISILCLPELCISGYNCEDHLLSPFVHEMSIQILQELQTYTKGMIVSVGLPLFFRNALFNVACLLVDGQIMGFACKRFLAGDGIHYEPRWFKPWPAGQRSYFSIGDDKYPIGDLIFQCGEIRIGFEICEDAWVASRPGRDLALKGVDIILNPSASHFAFTKYEDRKRFVLDGSRSFGIAYIYSNLVGNEAGKAIYDGGALIASSGTLLAASSRFSFKKYEVISALIDIEKIRFNRVRVASLLPHVSESDEQSYVLNFSYPEVNYVNEKVYFADWEYSKYLKEEEFVRCEILGLFDYMQKSKSHGFVLSLSGGADSSTIAILIGYMVRFGINELGINEFKSRLSYIKRLKNANIETEIIKELLLCVYQATSYSSILTQHAAEKIAKVVGAEFMLLDINDIIDTFVNKISVVINREITWDKDDIALQNIQARVRSPGVWMLANLRNALLLTTSNRSEAAVGYATMDGDTSGGICPLGGIDKSFIRQWLIWAEKQGPLGLGGIADLKYVNDQEPTAELRPQTHKQSDENDLMPYDILNDIERLLVKDKKSPLDIWNIIKIKYCNYSQVDICHWVEKFFKLWSKNQWKRERYAPSFHLDDYSSDPKTWCRFPILLGCFDEEIKIMKKEAKID